ncbi:CBF-domain-containing protein [Neoconidiobolus thromboides FSU 785]|nr:CBF-domain-containing protein [Neoconidiobolus thromboides FSU 785]
MDQRLKKPLKKKVLDETSLWYEIPLEDLKEGSNFDRDFANELLETAKDLIQQENELSENGNKSQSDQQFMADIMQSGTLSDKISALTLQIQESPLHHLKEFSKLLMMMRRNNRRESMLCLNSLKDLCLSCLLPSDRKLKYFFDQPLSSPNVTQKHLIIWYFEDYLKKAYFDFLLISEQRGHDPLLHSKQSMLNYFYELLSQKPEQESNLLTLIGDKENKIASKASYLLLQVLENHPGMKQIVATEIENILFRSNISLRAQYYSVITLNQFSLSRDDAELSNSLMETYFTLFKKILAIKEERPNKKKTKKDRKKDKNSNNKGKLQIKESTASSEDSEKIGLIAGILTGVNRAFPFSKIDPVSLKEHINTIFYIAKSFNFNAAIQALNFLNQISTQQPIYRDRYMKALYETLFDHRLIYSSKQAMYLNLLYKSLKQDTSIARVMSFVKRMFQVSMWHQPPFVNGLIYLTYKLSSIHKVINASIEQAEDTFEHNQSSEPKEDTKDIKDEVRDLGESNEETKGKVEATVPEVKEGNKTINSALYQGRYDDPKKSYAEYTCLWELGLLMNHFHPSVNHHINQLLKLEEIKEQPLLHLHTLQHFLDIFAYRNPKKVSEENSYNSFMKGSAFKAVNGVIWDKQSGISSAEVVNSEEFWKKSDSEVQAEHQFFHKYFKLTKSNNAEKKKAKDKEMSDSEDEDEDEIWKAMKGSTNIDEMEDDADMDEDVDLGDMDFSEDGMDDEDEDEDEDEDIQDFIENGEALNSHDDDDNDNDNELANTKDAISFDDILLNGDDDSDDNVSDPQDSGEDSESGDIDFDMGESSEEELGEETITNKKKSKETNKRKLNEPTKVGPNNERNVKKREQRKKLKSLPMFASAEDYDHLLEEE